jgi:hypothetical protein
MYEASGRTEYSVLDAWWAKHPLLTGRVPLNSVLWTVPCA